jgi:hypothetical protein
MNNVGTLTSHSDFSGAGFGNCFIQLQKCKLEHIKKRLSQGGVHCLLSYNYQRNLAEARFVLIDDNSTHVANLILIEQRRDFEDRNKPYVHYVYNYDVYVRSTDGLWLRVAFSQHQENRNVPENIATSIDESLMSLARSHNLFPKVRTVDFSAARALRI